MLKTISTTRWRRPSTSRPAFAKACAPWPRIGADLLRQVREPLGWALRLGLRGNPSDVQATFAAAARGPVDHEWEPPGWLLPHQVDAVRRLAGSIAAFGGALCADAVGLGKTYVALALATRYSNAVAVVPAVLEEQWRRRAAAARVPLVLVSHESLSRDAPVPRAGLTIVDEAHRFRNPDTNRYRALSRRPGPDHLLLLTATPVVNRSADFIALLRLFLPDNGLAVLGVSSLEDAMARRDHGAIALAATSVTVARSAAVVAAGALPVALDAVVVTPSPVPSPHLEPLLHGIAGLQFPTFGDRTAARLLGLHLRYRFASSITAGRETLRHHLAYLDRALGAARQGERLSRPAAAALLREELDGQLELELPGTSHLAVVDAGELERERARVAALLFGVAAAGAKNPKLDHLLGLLSARQGRKTIVFTTAIATAKAIAGAVGWRETAVVSGKGAWIASGKISVQEALSLFAPRARSAPPPGPARRVATLIATDLASEGLDLQDADAVVHFDLPWTPLRLDQRLGRIARLGSIHETVEVHWFAPPAELDADMGLRNRIAHKLTTQFALGVPQSSAVGRAQISSRAFEWRERLASLPARESTPRFAVVRGPPAAVFVMSWHRGKCRIPEILALDQGSLEPMREPAPAGALLDELLGCPVSDAPFDAGPWLGVLQSVVRNRLSRSEQPACDTETRQLARHVVRRATRAARMRDGELLAGMDRALARLLAGVRAGQADKLRGTMEPHGGRRALGVWLASQSALPGVVTVTLDGAIFGDGSGRALSSRLSP